MNRTQFLLSLSVMAVMSLAGSFLAVYVLGSGEPLSAQEGTDKVVTSEFQLKDSKGKLRALMKVDDEGELLFTLLDAKEQVRITQRVENNGAGAIVISDNNGRPRMSLTSDSDTAGAFSVFDAKGEPAALLAVGSGDFPMLTLKAPSGQAILGIQPNGTGVLNLGSIGAEGEKGDYFSVVGGAKAPTAMILRNAQGGGEVQLTAAADGNTILSIREKGETRCLLSSGAGGTTAMQLHNGSGSTVYMQAQKSGAAVMQLNGGENYLRAMSNGDGTAEYAIVKEKKFAWKETGK
jgi:hypothetical protein